MSEEPVNKEFAKLQKKRAKAEALKQKWINRQMTGFLYWVNSYLQKEDYKIENLLTGFSDGVLLIKFLELLTDGKIQQRYTQNPTMKVHKITNCYLALQFLEQQQIRGLTISAEDLVDGENIPAILGFCWQLLRQFQDTMGMDGDDDLENSRKVSSLEAKLLKWVKKLLEPYGIEIEDWKGFQDGKALLALVHSYDNSILDYQGLDKSDPFANSQLALQLAEEHISIPSELLDAEEIADGSVSEKNMALYLTLLYNAFKERENSMSKQSLIEMINDLEEEIQSVKKQTADLQEEQKALETEIEQQKEGINSERIEVQNIEDWKAKTSKEWGLEREMLLAELEKLEKDIADLKATSDGTTATLQQESEVLLAEKGTLSKETEQLKEDIRTLKKENAVTHKKSIREERATENLASYFEDTKKLRDHGLEIIKKQVLSHFHDVNVWSNFLNDGDVNETYEDVLDEEGLHELAFEEQFDKINSFVNDENTKVSELLKVKLTEFEDQEKEERKKRAKKAPRAVRVVKKV